jgi:hypothetical protein
MNLINKSPVDSIGYNFIPNAFLPAGKDEYHQRFLQNPQQGRHRNLSAHEIEGLVRNNNTSDDWNKILVSEAFNPERVRNCKFFGLVRIGKLEPWSLEFHNLRVPVGLYNSTIISSDIGDNVVVDNVNYLSHYIIGNDVILVNVNELAATSTAKFGNGILKEGENESGRIWLEVCNENGGRGIIPFNGMLPGDAFLWARYRDDEALMAKFITFTEDRFSKQRGHYGQVGDRTVIKNCRIIKDAQIGSDAYLKGANKIKNVTINSGPDAPTQIGEGCELVNGIVGAGCRVFYGVKAVRFFIASHSQLKYGARLINSYLGDNSTISCCEVLNSLIFPAHEQHHNNSFLCASMVMGQSNMAAGATIGSNHNSRGADGELQAGRGFWPGLCVSLKHNSRFASFNILAKGDFPAELDIPIPFALVSNDVKNDELVVMPGYWFMYNLYALTRNEWKYKDRDARMDKAQELEFGALAPDSVNEMFEAVRLFRLWTGKALRRKKGITSATHEATLIREGARVLDTDPGKVAELEVLGEHMENSQRNVRIIKLDKAYPTYVRMVRYYGIMELLEYIGDSGKKGFRSIKATLPWDARRLAFVNLGGQLVPSPDLEAMKKDIRKGRIKGWDGVHAFYTEQGRKYRAHKFRHAFAALKDIGAVNREGFTANTLRELVKEAAATKAWITDRIEAARAKDYENPFRHMVYGSQAEMDSVLGKLSENGFIRKQKDELEAFRKKTGRLLRSL